MANVQQFKHISKNINTGAKFMFYKQKERFIETT